MTIANTFAAKASVAFVAVAMALSMVAPAQAQTAEELQAQIDTLMATIASLQAQAGGTATVSADAYVFTRALTIGSQGADVTALQNYLIGAGFSIPAGATGYFGAQTQAAVAAWQTANGVMPAAGYFGPVSQAKYNELMAAMPDDSDDDSSDDDASDDDDSSSDELSGEASLGDVESSDGDDSSIEEGQEAAPVAEFEVEFNNGDAIIDRVDLAFTATGEEDPWDTFEEVSLWVDGDEVASMAADDEDEYLSDEQTLRFSGLDIVAMEDETVTIVVGVTVAGSVDDLPADWEVDMTEIRYTDADEVTTTDDVTVDAVDFDIDVEGADDEIIVKSSSEDPDATTLQLEEDSNSDWLSVFAFDLDTDDSTNDIELNSVEVEVTVSSSTYSAIVNDAQLVIDGEEFDDVTVTNGNTTTGTLVFDIDGDYTIEAGERVTAELQLEFKSLETGNEGMTVSAIVDMSELDAEGADDITPDGSDVSGETHTLRTSGIVVESTADSADATVVDGSDNDYATFEIEVDVTAFEDPAYISQVGATAFTYQIEDSNGNAIGSSTATSSTISSDADVESGFYVVEEGETESFTLRVTLNPLAADEGDSYRLQILTIEFNDTAAAPTETWTASPASEYETDFELIND